MKKKEETCEMEDEEGETEAMTEINEKLKELQERLARQRKLDVMLTDLERQRFSLQEEVHALDEARQLEQADVDRLEGHSLAAFFYALTGQKESRLDKERAEAYAAAVKYDAAKAQLDAVERDISGLKIEKGNLKAIEAELNRLLQQKQESLKASDPVHGAEILRLEEQIAALDALDKEIRESVWAGNDVLRQIEQIERKLSSAEGWGTWDLLGGGMISGIAKHSALDDAQRMVADLQILLRRFRTELTDVQVSADLQIQMDGFLRFADYFFDGLFADWAALNHIHSSQQQVSDTKFQVQRVMTQLQLMQQQTGAEREQLQGKLRDLVVNA